MSNRGPRMNGQSRLAREVRNGATIGFDAGRGKWLVTYKVRGKDHVNKVWRESSAGIGDPRKTAVTAATSDVPMMPVRAALNLCVELEAQYREKSHGKDASQSDQRGNADGSNSKNSKPGNRLGES